MRMAISVVAPVSTAIEHTKRMLFRPADATKWLVLAFAAWLAHLGDSGGANFNLPTGNFNTRPAPAAGPRVVPPPPVAPPAAPPKDMSKMPAPEPGQEPAPAPEAAPADAPAPDADQAVAPLPPAPAVPPVNVNVDAPDDDDFQQMLGFARRNLNVILAIGAVLLVIGLALAVVLTWLKARGTFLFLDGVARDRALVAEPWKEYAREANALFRFEVALWIVGLLAFLAIAGAGVGLAWPDIQAQQFGRHAITGIAVGVPLLLMSGIAFGLIRLFLVDFIAPIMYRRRVGTGEAWRAFRTELLPGRTGTFAAYVLFQFLINIVTGILSTVIVCVTCCIAALPYVGTVATLPLLVFRRAYSLAFLEQFGPEWQLLAGPSKPTMLTPEDLMG